MNASETVFIILHTDTTTTSVVMQIWYRQSISISPTNTFRIACVCSLASLNCQCDESISVRVFLLSYFERRLSRQTNNLLVGVNIQTSFQFIRLFYDVEILSTQCTLKYNRTKERKNKNKTIDNSILLTLTIRLDTVMNDQKGVTR